MNLTVDHNNGAAGADILPFDYSTWQSHLQMGRREARSSRRAVLVSYTQQIPYFNLLTAFASARDLAHDTFYWERPDEGHVLVGIGAAATCSATTVKQVASCWRSLMDRAEIHSSPAGIGCDHPQVTGPLCLSGFAFDSDLASTPLWREFPSALLLVPAILFGRSGVSTFLTMNVLVQPPEDAEDPDTEADEIAHKVGYARTVLDAVERSLRRESSTQPVRPQLEHVCLRDLQSRGSWKRMVETATAAIQEGAYRKVVLARSVMAEAPEPFMVAPALADLSQRYADAHVFALSRRGHTFLGASPERLARVEGTRVETMALAGSAPRGASLDEDTRLGEDLLRQKKTHTEHAIVAERILEALSPLTTMIHSPAQPELLKLQNVQHLLTPISGELISGTSVLEVVAALHPTPAVAGEPQSAALEAIRSVEHLDRGWYAGPIGWIGADGSGEFAVALRSALVEENRATLFAGCGIVAGSDPQAEYDESCWKLQVMLQSLCGGVC
jgi:isochorismate synthase